jgi:uncharacterized membrane protein
MTDLVPYLLDWLNFLVRWFHLIAGIAWIGASFYFIWLDSHLRPPLDEDSRRIGIGGEVWAVHGGGFYRAQKFSVAPPELPPTLHWFKWESYATWISGFFMLCLVYYASAEINLIDPSVMALSKPLAIGIGLAFLVGGWLVYDLLCRSPLGRHEPLLAALMFVLLCVAAWGLTQIFSGRGAFIHFGAMLGTIMSANVLMVIIPGQRALVAAKQAGLPPDPIHGIRGKQRSVHNTYFTLPVLFVMISNHYAFLTNAEQAWLVLILISLAGALIRLAFVMRHRGTPRPLLAWIGVALIAAVIVILAPRPAAPVPAAAAGVATAAAPTMDRIRLIMDQRCVSCHAAQPTQPGFASPPKNVILDSEERILTQARAIHQHTVVLKSMPIANLTQMTDAERAEVDQWFRSLAARP